MMPKTKVRIAVSLLAVLALLDQQHIPGSFDQQQHQLADATMQVRFAEGSASEL